MGIWGFLEENKILLSLVLLIQKTKTPHDFPLKAKKSETVMDFPKDKRKLGRLATLVLH